MATYNQERTIKEYWAQVKHLYPNMTFEKFEETCKFPTYWVKQKMKEGTFITIMVKYLGKFIVYPKRVKFEITTQGKFLDRGVIDQETHDERVALYNDFLSRYEEDYNTYELEDDYTKGEASD